MEGQQELPIIGKAGENNSQRHPLIAQFFHRAAVDIWHNLKGSDRWITISSRFLDLQNMLEVNTTKDHPYDCDIANELRKFFRYDAPLQRTLTDFEATLSKIWSETHDNKWARAGAQAEERARAEVMALAEQRTREAAQAELVKLRKEREIQQEKDQKLIAEFVMVEEDHSLEEEFVVVDEKQMEEQWEVVGEP